MQKQSQEYSAKKQKNWKIKHKNIKKQLCSSNTPISYDELLDELVSPELFQTQTDQIGDGISSLGAVHGL